jgi:hypothetical protein
MRPYYFDFDSVRTRHATTILTFERAMRRGRPPRPPRRNLFEVLSATLSLLWLWRRRARERE